MSESRSTPVYTSKAEGFRPAEEIAALRPARENAPKQRAKPILREVTNGIVCYCGQRFSEGQALDFMLHLRSEVGNDLAYLERRRAESRERGRRLGADPEWRARKNQRARERHYRNSHPCECGCGGIVGTGSFLPGHQKRLIVVSCGTESGHSRHRRLGEKPCAECMAAVNEAARRRRAAKNAAKNGPKRKPQGRKPTPIPREEVVRLYRDEGVGLKALGKMMHTHHRNIVKVLSEAGVPIRDRRPRVRTLASDTLDVGTA